MSAPAAADPVIIGVRHHSPACARVVAETIRALRPAHVLIEGPADMNPRMGELLLGHTPPLAIFSYLSGPVSDDETMHHAAYTPFAQCSPEWQAIQLGAEQGAAVRFIDLPAWHPDMAEIADRYAASEQARENSERYLDALAAELGTDSFDTTWDRLFEDTAHLPVTELAERLRVHFEQLRADDAGSASNQAREQMMASWIAWAVRRGEGPVVVVCGGYHAPALARRWRELDGSLPEVAEPASLGSELRHGSFLVPYTHKQLDAMAGYGAGMSSPGYYDDVWREGAERAGVKLVRGVLGRLRAKKQQASTADFIAIVTKARALAQVRGHHSTLRNDWLDAIAGALVRDALTVPLPWSYRGLLRPGTDPILVEVVDVLGGNAAGRLAEGTPQPPLVADVAETLDRLAIPQLGRLQLDLFDAADLARSHALHQLAILGIPGVERVSGPSSATSGERAEVWSLRRDRHRDAALIEAGSYGATLEGAAGARLAAQIAESSGAVAALAGLLNAAAQAGLSQLQGDLLPRLREGIGAEPKLEELGLALGILYPLRRHADWLALASSPVLTETIDAAIDRALWLLEPASVIAPADTNDHLRTMAEGGGTGITTMPVLQSLAQARDKWSEDQAAAIWDSSIAKIILGGASNSRDLQDLSTLIGERDEFTDSVTLGDYGSRSSQRSVRRVPIMPPDRIRTMPFGTGVLLLRSVPPIIIDLLPWPKRSDAASLRRERREIETLLENRPNCE